VAGTAPPQRDATAQLEVVQSKTEVMMPSWSAAFAGRLACLLFDAQRRMRPSTTFSPDELPLDTGNPIVPDQRRAFEDQIARVMAAAPPPPAAERPRGVSATPNFIVVLIELGRRNGRQHCAGRCH
jgi:hypothetical protein